MVSKPALVGVDVIFTSIDVSNGSLYFQQKPLRWSGYGYGSAERVIECGYEQTVWMVNQKPTHSKHALVVADVLHGSAGAGETLFGTGAGTTVRKEQ